jgi:hypothetical protein
MFLYRNKLIFCSTLLGIYLQVLKTTLHKALSARPMAWPNTIMALGVNHPANVLQSAIGIGGLAAEQKSGPWKNVVVITAVVFVCVFLETSLTKAVQLSHMASLKKGIYAFVSEIFSVTFRSLPGNEFSRFIAMPHSLTTSHHGVCQCGSE